MIEREAKYDYMIFAKNLNVFLKLKGKTQASLSRDLKIPTATINTWCNGQAMPPINTIYRIAVYLDISISDLLEEPVSHADFRSARNKLYYMTAIATPNQLKQIIKLADVILNSNEFVDR